MAKYLKRAGISIKVDYVISYGSEKDFIADENLLKGLSPKNRAETLKSIWKEAQQYKPKQIKETPKEE